MTSVIAGQTEQLHHYLMAREALTHLQEQLDEPTMWNDVLDPSEVAPDRLDAVVATLCRQARAAQQLASAAESLCAALVGESHYCRI